MESVGKGKSNGVVSPAIIDETRRSVPVRVHLMHCTMATSAFEVLHAHYCLQLLRSLLGC